MAEERQSPPDDEPDQTRAHQPAAEEPAQPPAAGDATQMLHPAEGERWSARAGVRPSQPSGYPQAYPPQAQPGYPPEAVAGEEYADRGPRWWAPALVAVIALVLLGILGFGIWLILQALERPGGPSPLPAPTTSTASASAPASPSPTVEPSPTPSPTPMVTVPQVVNVPLADAQAALDRVGLRSQVVERPDGNVRPNTVVAAAPAPGTEVPVGSTVTLYVAVTPPPTSRPPTVAPTVTWS